MNDFQHMRDPIWGNISINDDLFAYIDTQQFQRLRHLKQLGFEHSLGTCEIANRLISKFKTEQPELDISDYHVKAIKIAALCHDIGHGPFSHVFDGEFIKKAIPNSNWSHEDASVMLLENLVSEINLNTAADDGGGDLDTKELSFVQNLIKGDREGYTEKKFLFDIVANKRNGIDVDKFDYLNRDCHYVGIKTNYDSSRLMSFSRVIGDEICYPAKDSFNVFTLFLTRYTLFKSVYTHKTAKAIEYMIVDILLNADPVLKISQMIHSPEEYTLLTDNILTEIAKSKDPKLEKSRQLIKRLNKRDLYKYVDQVGFDPEQRSRVKKSMITPEKICDFAIAGKNELKADEVIVEWLEVGMGFGDKNPIDRVSFYTKYKMDEKFAISKRNYCPLFGNNYTESSVRIFSRDGGKKLRVKVAFRKLIENSDIDIQDNEDNLSSPPQFQQTSSSSIVNTWEDTQYPGSRSPHFASSSHQKTFETPTNKRQRTTGLNLEEGEERASFDGRMNNRMNTLVGELTPSAAATFPKDLDDDQKKYMSPRKIFF